MDVRLELTGESNPELSQRMARDVLGAIREDVDATARLDARPGAPGDRGEVFTIAAIIMAIVQGGAIGKLLEVLGAWINRKPHLVYKLKRPDGSELEINSDFFNSKTLEDQTAIVRDFMKP